MRAPAALPRRSSTRAIHPLVALMIAAITAITVATAVSPIAVADPPPSTVGPWLEVAPTLGHVADSFTASYWYIDPSGGSCSYATVKFSWDGVGIGSASVDPATCSAARSLKPPPGATLGPHRVSAVACYVDSTGGEVCDGFTATAVSYYVDPTPTLSVKPSSGEAASAFSATYSTNALDCGYTDAQFLWDDKPIGSPVPLDASCGATLDLSAAPLPNDVGPHVVTAEACDGSFCDPATLARTTYTIAAPPPATLILAPTTGTTDAPFTATYSTNGASCPFSDAEFFWDGTPIGGRVALDASCSAVLPLAAAPLPNDVGSHTLTAEACSRACDASTLARATFVVTAPRPTAAPTATPRAAPTATPTAAPTAAPTARPTATPAATPAGSPGGSPATSPSTEPSGIPSASGETPSPSPTGAVLGGETNRPTFPPAPAQGAVVPPSSPPGGENSYVPAIVSYIGGPDAGPIDPAVVATNLMLTLLIVFLFALTAEIFNSTMDANRDEVHGWWTGLMRGPLAFLGALTFAGEGLDRLSGSGRMGSILRVLTVLGLLGLIYGFLSPDFGLNPQSLVLFVSLVIGLGFITYFSEGSSSRLAIRRYHADASIKLYGTAVLVAILAVVVSRSVSFQPGLVYGFIASAVIIAPVALAKRDDATLVLVPAFGILVVSLLAWLLLGPVRVAAAGGSPLPALAETILAMLVIGGLEGLFITMIPLRFMDGAAVMGWSRVAWALVFGTVTFLWWQLLLNQNAAYAAAFEQTNVRVVLATLGVFMLTTGGLWSYFRFRPDSTGVEA